MTDILSIIEDLRSNNSRNHKKNVLEKYKCIQLLQSTLDYTYNPFKQYGIKKIPEYKSNHRGIKGLDSVNCLLDNLIRRDLTGNAAIESLRNTLESLNDRDAKVLELIIKKDLSAGISTSTINEVFGENFIPEYPILLAESYSEKKLKKIPLPAIAQIKEDGERFNAIASFDNGNKDVVFKTRKGHIISGLKHIAEIILLLTPDQDEYVFDGELLVIDENGNILKRAAGNGILNKALKGTISEYESQRVICVLWDAIPYKDWQRGECSIPYKVRFNKLADLINNGRKQNTVRLARTRIVNSPEEIKKFFMEVAEQGLEGIIVKNQNRLYWRDERSADQVKVKVEGDCDLSMIAFEEGNGAYRGMCGSVLCISSDHKLEVNVKPRTMDDARKIWADTGFYFGKILKVKHNGVFLPEKKPKYSLCNPVFLEIREDKEIADPIDRILEY